MRLQSIYGLPLAGVRNIMLTTLIVWSVISIMLRRANAWGLSLWREINRVMTGISFIAILRFTILRRSREYTQSIPFFRTVKDIIAQPELIREMVMNTFLFFPFGLTLPYALRKKKVNHPVKITIIIALGLSCTIEFVQFVCHFGNVELSDIIMNTFGASIGCISYSVSNLQCIRREKSNLRKK